MAKQWGGWMEYRSPTAAGAPEAAGCCPYSWVWEPCLLLMQYEPSLSFLSQACMPLLSGHGFRRHSPFWKASDM